MGDLLHTSRYKVTFSQTRQNAERPAANIKYSIPVALLTKKTIIYLQIKIYCLPLQAENVESII